MVQKYIIDKADIHNLLTGKEIPLGQGSKARAFCVEIAGGMTNGEVIEALFPNATFKDAFIDTFAEITFVGSGYALLKKEWLESPYKRGDK